MEFPLIETICIERGEIQNIALHQQRYEQSLRRFYGKSAVKIYDLFSLIQNSTDFSPALSQPLVRCRAAYHHSAVRLQFFPYRRKAYRAFQPVICDEIDYALKYSDRTLLNRLLAQRGQCDEIMIIKHGWVTDCSIGNLVFRRQGEWFTPDTPLLKGTQRQKLLNEGKIREIAISLRDMDRFDEIRLINAMNGLAD